MARRLPRRALSAFAGAGAFAASIALAAAPDTPAGAAKPPDGAAPTAATTILARFDFDDDGPESGPDTLAVFEHAKGRVRLSREIVRGGWRSLMLTDVAGDGDFPELQAYFPIRRSGILRLGFSLLVTDPAEELNIALAGPGGFGLGRDGIAVWLATRGGWLIHTSDSIPKRLHALTPFVWYRVEIALALDAGRYDLRLFEERREQPVLALVRQPTAASHAGAAVGVLSFIGDNGDDLSNATYFVDDVELAADDGPRLRPFVAPGRRKLFVELIERYGDPHGAAPGCPTVHGPEDLGIDASRASKGLGAILAAATAAPGASAGTGAGARDLEAIGAWREGCAALLREDFVAAETSIREALRWSGGAPLYRLSLVAVLLRSGAVDAAESELAALRPDHEADPRFSSLAARVAALRGFAGEAEEWLGRALDASKSEAAIDSAMHAAFHWLLRERRFVEAEELAATMVSRSSGEEQASARARWIELGGDAAFAADSTARAEAAYRAARELSPDDAGRLDLKLADLAFVRGDLDAERRLRESIYGALREAE